MHVYTHTHTHTYIHTHIHTHTYIHTLCVFEVSINPVGQGSGNHGSLVPPSEVVAISNKGPNICPLGSAGDDVM